MACDALFRAGYQTPSGTNDVVQRSGDDRRLKGSWDTQGRDAGAPGPCLCSSGTNERWELLVCCDDTALATWGVSSFPSLTTQLYQVVNGNLTKIGADWNLAHLSTPKTLTKFLTTSMAMIPAVHNQLIMSVTAEESRE